MFYYVISPTGSRELGDRKNVFGPYYTREQAEDVRDKMESLTLVLKFATQDRDEVVRRLEGVEWTVLQELSDMVEGEQGESGGSRP